MKFISEDKTTTKRGTITKAHETAKVDWHARPGACHPNVWALLGFYKVSFVP